MPTSNNTPAILPYFVADKSGKYQAKSTLTEAQIIKAAAVLLNKQVKRDKALTSPDITRAYLQTKLRKIQHEVFACLFLDNQHRVIKFEKLFRGTIDGASVYPREVVKQALKLNAAAVIFAHNHPSGETSPSMADKLITAKLKQALSLFDIRTLDHFIIGDGLPYSFAEHGLI